MTPRQNNHPPDEEKDHILPPAHYPTAPEHNPDQPVISQEIRQWITSTEKQCIPGCCKYCTHMLWFLGTVLLIGALCVPVSVQFKFCLNNWESSKDGTMYALTCGIITSVCLFWLFACFIAISCVLDLIPGKLLFFYVDSFFYKWYEKGWEPGYREECTPRAWVLYTHELLRWVIQWSMVTQIIFLGFAIQIVVLNTLVYLAAVEMWFLTVISCIVQTALALILVIASVFMLFMLPCLLMGSIMLMLQTQMSLSTKLPTVSDKIHFTRSGQT